MPNRKDDFPRARLTLSRPISAAALSLAGFALFWPVTLATSTVVEAKTPGKTYCFLGKCHRVRTLEETRRLIGVRTVVKASHYDDPKKDRFNPSNLTASGEWFRAGAADNAASPTLPNGTVLLAYNPVTRKAAVVRVNNAGPYWGGRTLDVSRGAAEKLGFARQGVATLVTQVIRAPTREDVTYRKGRRYAAVPGFIGTHASLDSALADAARRMGGAAPASPAVTPVAAGTTVASADNSSSATRSAGRQTLRQRYQASQAAKSAAKLAAVKPAPDQPAPSGEATAQTVAATTTPAAPAPAVVAAAATAIAVRQARKPAPRKPTKVAQFDGSLNTATRLTGTPTRTATPRRGLDANGYFTVDCRSTPQLCGNSNSTTTTGSVRTARTSLASTSKRP